MPFSSCQNCNTGDNIRREEEHLSMVLSTNGYPEHVIHIAAGPRRKRKQLEEPPKYTISLPYVAGLGEELRRVCRK